MDTDRGPLATRGRSCSPHIRSFSPYASWYPPGRDRSPHFSPDRITRYASPSRQPVDQDQDDIVPRIPQPYRTSFSAITSPQRVPKTPPPSSTRIHGVGPLARSTPARSTMPGRIVPVRSASQSSPPKKPPRTFVYTKASQFQHRSESDATRRNHSTSDFASPNLTVNANSVAKPLRSCDQYKTPPSELMADGRLESVASTVDSVFCDSYGAPCDASVANTTFDSLDQSDTRTSSKEPPLPPPSDDSGSFKLIEPEKKLIIEKEYLHVIEVRPPGETKTTAAVKATQPVKSEKITRKGLRKIFRGKKKEKNFKKEPQSFSGRSDSETSTSSPQLARKGKQGPLVTRSAEMLSEVHKEPVRTKGKKLSSITRLFKRMSPKTLRKTDDKPEISTTSQTSSCTDSLQGEVLAYQNGESRSVHSNQSHDSSSSLAKTPKNSPAMKIKAKDSSSLQPKKDCNATQEPTTPTLPSSSARMLKSIGETSHATAEKSVYRAFKERQSPRPPPGDPAASKSQALRAVEFPENLLHGNDSQSPPAVYSPGPLSSHQGAFASGTASSDSPVSSSSASASGISGKEGSARKQDPPQTLNVHDVSKLNKHVFAFSSMSAESIGQCSLDPMGSDPSLVSKNGGQRSSNASKRTLTSQENITATPLKSQLLQNSTSDGTSQKSSSQSPLPPVETATTLPNKDVTDNSGSPKTPSYLKLSCALGGYNKYSNYASPKAENRIRVVRGGSVDSIDDVDENTIPNGHIDVDPVTSSKVKVSEAPNNSTTKGPTKATVKITQNGATVTRLSNGGVEYPPLQPKPVLYNRTNENSNSEDSVPAQPVVNGVKVAERTPADGLPECNVPNADTLSQSVEGAKPVAVFSTPEQNKDSDSDTPTPSKDGKYFMSVMDREDARLVSLCGKAENDLRNNIPEEASGKVRATIGKANLLTTKKFRQFRGLCERNMEQDSDDQFQTTSQDLAGFWDMVLIQVDDVVKMFSDLDKLRQNGWREERTTPVQPKKSLGATPTKTRSGRPKGGATPKSAKSQEAAKAREEARRRLLEAKRAGRERKASQSDKEEVEIYVN